MSDGQSDIDWGARENILQEADKITSGARQEAYDHPLPNHTRIARLWEAYLVGKYGQAPTLAPEDVCWMMVLVKIARDMHAPRRDNLTDVAGYARCIERIREPGRTGG